MSALYLWPCVQHRSAFGGFSCVVVPLCTSRQRGFLECYFFVMSFIIIQHAQLAKFLIKLYRNLNVSLCISMNLARPETLSEFCETWSLPADMFSSIFIYSYYSHLVCIEKICTLLRQVLTNWAKEIHRYQYTHCYLATPRHLSLYLMTTPKTTTCSHHHKPWSSMPLDASHNQH